ncbi:hypothetical protein CSC94_00780 [Zhengella mangrovi]|uniref:Uncharacterized protein n=1 Tax=Zhengella mangrovi TaxID=1982044 RepID=A0A2G1QUG3_9HYPH|nr:invasion associated locus B family protein [Zhengella mangrovi]PHP69131.1 hypothetical protein CSC94_00780 [Zhengella mangrovi]
MHGLKTTLATLTILAAAMPAALAQSPVKLSQHTAWGTYAYDTKQGKVCYVLSVPETKEPASLDHGDIYFFVSMKPGENVSYEPQFITSYAMKEGSKVTVSIDGKPFSMFVRGKSGWLENAAEEPQLVAAMKAGTKMKVDAVSGRGNDTHYLFSLSGITAALDSISSCK